MFWPGLQQCYHVSTVLHNSDRIHTLLYVSKYTEIFLTQYTVCSFAILITGNRWTGICIILFVTDVIHAFVKTSFPCLQYFECCRLFLETKVVGEGTALEFSSVTYTLQSLFGTDHVSGIAGTWGYCQHWRKAKSQAFFTELCRKLYEMTDNGLELKMTQYMVSFSHPLNLGWL